MNYKTSHHDIVSNKIFTLLNNKALQPTKLLLHISIKNVLCGVDRKMLMEYTEQLANNHISVDCVVIGFDGEKLKVLLVKRMGEESGEVFHDMKLPGSLIYMDEDLDDAAKRVLRDLTGLKNVDLMQFKAFGSKDRTKNPKDVHWLERAEKAKVERIVTIAYFAMVK